MGGYRHRGALRQPSCHAEQLKIRRSLAVRMFVTLTGSKNSRAPVIGLLTNSPYFMMTETYGKASLSALIANAPFQPGSFWKRANGLKSTVEPRVTYPERRLFGRAARSLF